MKTNTRETLLAQALNLFARKGYDGTGVQEIVNAANVSKPTLYHYFQDKIGLLQALLDEKLVPLLEELEKTGTDPDTKMEQDLTRCGDIICEYAAQNPQAYRLFLNLMFAPPESPQFEAAVVHAQRQFAAIERIFTLYRENAPDRPDRDDALCAAVFQGLVHNLITLFLHGHVRLDHGLVKQSVHRFVHGLYAAEPFKKRS